jgi:outer membrane receptor protein involved in Fe transport
MLLGFANQKINLNASVNITKDLSFNITGSYYGARWAYTSVDTLGLPVLEKTNPLMLVNVFLKYNTPVKGLMLGAGVYDLLDQKYHFIQPYSNANTPGHAPLPGPGREFVFRLSYDLQMNKQN